MEQKLMYFYNIGPSIAKKIIAKMIKLKLIQSQSDNKSISSIKKILLGDNFYYDLPIATKYDLIYSPLRIIPRDIIDKLNKILSKYLDKHIKYNIAGSYIRGKKTSSDVDIVMINNYSNTITLFNNLLILLKDAKIKILQPFAMGSDKIATLINIDNVYIKVDIFITTEAEYIYTMLFATGSGSFNILMRYIAKKKGYKLNHKGLWTISGKKINIKSELDLFEILGMKYRTPEARN